MFVILNRILQVIPKANRKNAPIYRSDSSVDTICILVYYYNNLGVVFQKQYCQQRTKTIPSFIGNYFLKYKRNVFKLELDIRRDQNISKKCFFYLLTVSSDCGSDVGYEIRCVEPLDMDGLDCHQFFSYTLQQNWPSNIKFGC